MSFTDGIDGYCRAFEEYMNKDTIQDLRREIDEMTCLVNGFRSENDRLKEENAKLSLSNKELKEENKQLEKININLDNEISELEKEQDNLKQEYKIAIDENNFFIKENARLEGKIKDLERVNEILTRRIFIDKCDHAVTKARELKNEKLKFEEEIKKLKEENKDLDKRLKDVEADWAATEYEKMQLEEAFDKISKQNVDLINALKNNAETKIYQCSAEDFAKTFKGQWTISIAPDEVSISDFTVNNENDKDRLSYYLTYKDTKYDEPFDKIYKYLKSYQIERVAIAKMLDEIRAEIKASKFVVKQSEADAQREQMWNDYIK